VIERVFYMRKIMTSILKLIISYFMINVYAASNLQADNLTNNSTKNYELRNKASRFLEREYNNNKDDLAEELSKNDHIDVAINYIKPFVKYNLEDFVNTDLDNLGGPLFSDADINKTAISDLSETIINDYEERKLADMNNEKERLEKKITSVVEEELSNKKQENMAIFLIENDDEY
jgi:hypothetical protein